MKNLKEITNIEEFVIGYIYYSSHPRWEVLVQVTPKKKLGDFLEDVYIFNAENPDLEAWHVTDADLESNYKFYNTECTSLEQVKIKYPEMFL